MKKVTQKLLIIASALIISTFSFSQTTAMDFQGDDCNGNPVHLFQDLDEGKAVVLFYYMDNCGSCPPPAQKIQAMANKIIASYPGKVKAYAYPYQDEITCSYSASWTTASNLPLYAPMDSGEAQIAYYGGFGMPTVVLVGGTDHRVLWSTQDFMTSDTTIMRDSILGLFTSTSIMEISTPVNSLEIYPNPTSDEINIQFAIHENAEIFFEIIDVSGRKVYEGKHENVIAGLVSRKINLSEIPTGNYLIQINVNGSVIQENLTIKH